jgi:outer membrane protein
MFVFEPFLCFAQDTISLQSCIDLLKKNERNFIEQNYDLKSNTLNKNYHIYSALPNLSASTSLNTSFGRRIDPFTNTFTTSNVNSQSYGLSSSMGLFNGFNYFYKRNIIRNSLQIAENNYEKTENEQIRSLIENYIQLCKIQLNLSISKKKINSIEQTQEIQRYLFKGGRISSVDTLKSFLSIKNEEITLNKLLTEKRLLEIDLNYKIGQPLNSVHSFSIATISNISDQILFNEFFEHEKAKLELQNVTENFKIAKAAMLPSISLNGNIGTGFSTNNKDYTLPGTPTKSYEDQLNQNLYESVGVYINIPIFSKGENLKQQKLLALKTDQLTESQKKIEVETIKKTTEIEQKIVSLTTEIALELELLKTLQLVFDKTELLYQEGRVPYTDLEYTRIQLFDKEIKIEQLKVDLVFLKLQIR